MEREVRRVLAEWVKKSSKAIKVRVSPEGDYYLNGSFGSTEPGTVQYIRKLALMSAHRDSQAVFMGDKFSIGPYQTATESKYALMNRRGDILAEGPRLPDLLNAKFDYLLL